MASILIADDDPILTELVRYKLEAIGHSLVAVGAGDQVVPAALAHRPDLLIVDWMMPALSGPQALRQLRATPEIAAIPAIMLSARCAQEDLAEAYRAGADDYIVKPFRFDELVERVDAVLKGAEFQYVAA